nr:hypothetical protein [Tanacetum cinerariifolium]
MSKEDQTIDVMALPKFDMSSYESSMSAKDVKSLAIRHGIPLDLHHVALTKGWTMDQLSDDMIGLHWSSIDLCSVPSGLLFQGGLATTWDFSGFHLVFKDTEENVVTMSEYLRFIFLSGATIEKGSAIINQDPRAQHIVPPLSVGQAIPDKTDHQKEVEAAGPKIVATHERKARAASKKREKKKRGPDEGEDPVGPNMENLLGGAANIAELHGDQSLHASHHESDHFGHDQTERNLTIFPTEVLQPSPGYHSVHRSLTAERTTSPARLSAQGAHGDEGGSSRDQAYYVPEWFIHWRCRVDNHMWCRELMIHLAPPTAQEESNALDNLLRLRGLGLLWDGELILKIAS